MAQWKKNSLVRSLVFRSVIGIRAKKQNQFYKFFKRPQKICGKNKRKKESQLVGTLHFKRHPKMKIQLSFAYPRVVFLLKKDILKNLSIQCFLSIPGNSMGPNVVLFWTQLTFIASTKTVFEHYSERKSNIFGTS